MTRKQRRLVLIGSSLGVLALAAVLVLSALQDSIVSQLLHLNPPPRPKPKPKTVDAYKAYAMSLATSSDAEKVEQLKDGAQVRQ